MSGPVEEVVGILGAGAAVGRRVLRQILPLLRHTTTETTKAERRGREGKGGEGSKDEQTGLLADPFYPVRNNAALDLCDVSHLLDALLGCHDRRVGGWRREERDRRGRGRKRRECFSAPLTRSAVIPPSAGEHEHGTQAAAAERLRHHGVRMSGALFDDAVGL